jgi:hypothetical protein
MEMTISGKRPELITIFEAQSRLAIRDGVGMLLRSAANMEAIFQWCSEGCQNIPKRRSLLSALQESHASTAGITQPDGTRWMIRVRLHVIDCEILPADNAVLRRFHLKLDVTGSYSDRCGSPSAETILGGLLAS